MATKAIDDFGLVLVAVVLAQHAAVLVAPTDWAVVVVVQSIARCQVRFQRSVLLAFVEGNEHRQCGV